jgi:hypothetical protein
MSDQPDAEDCLVTYHTLKVQMSMRAARFEPTTPATVRAQTHAFDRAALGSAHIFMLAGRLPSSEYTPLYKGVWRNRDIAP